MMFRLPIARLLIKCRPPHLVSNLRRKFRFPAAVLLTSSVVGVAESAREEVPLKKNLVKVTYDRRASPSLFKDFRHLLKKLIFALNVFLRSLQLALICSPAVLTSPVLWLGRPEWNRWWYAGLTRSIQRCGPIFVKLGQWASTRRDIFPKALCDELTKLQRKNNAHSWAETEKVLVRNFGPNYCDMFLSFDKNPVGSGCCAQVYRAKLNGHVGAVGNGDQVKEDVAVKVLHPNIREKFRRDLSVIESFGDLISFIAPKLAEFLSIRESVKEFSTLMKGQMDLEIEVNNIKQFRGQFRSDSSVVFPVAFDDLCRKDVLVESFEEGLHVSELIDNDLTKDTDNKKVALLGIKMLLKMIFAHNFVHGDLHPGNILVRFDDSFPEGVQLVILDHGIVSSLSAKDMTNLRSVFYSVIKGDGDEVGRLFLEHSHHQCPPDQREAFVKDISAIVFEARSKQLSLDQIDVSTLLGSLFETLLKHRVRLESHYVSVMLAIMVLEGLGRSLDSTLDILKTALPYVIAPRQK